MKKQIKKSIISPFTELLYQLNQFVAGVPNEWLTETVVEKVVSATKLSIKRLPHHGQINY